MESGEPGGTLEDGKEFLVFNSGWLLDVLDISETTFIVIGRRKGRRLEKASLPPGKHVTKTPNTATAK